MKAHQQQTVSATPPGQGEGHGTRQRSSDCVTLTCRSRSCSGCSSPGWSSLRYPESRSGTHDSLRPSRSEGSKGESAQSFNTPTNDSSLSPSTFQETCWIKVYIKATGRRRCKSHQSLQGFVLNSSGGSRVGNITI